MAKPSPQLIDFTWQLFVLSRLQSPYLLTIESFGIVDHGEAARITLTYPHLPIVPWTELAPTLMPVTAADLFEQSLRGLATLHDQGCLHGAVKLENLHPLRDTGDHWRVCWAGYKLTKSDPSKWAAAVRNEIVQLASLWLTLFKQQTFLYDALPKQFLNLLQNIALPDSLHAFNNAHDILYELAQQRRRVNVPIKAAFNQCPADQLYGRHLIMQSLHFQIQEYLESASDQHSNVSIIFGEKGAGKSAIFDELLIWSALSGYQTLHLRNTAKQTIEQQLNNWRANETNRQQKWVIGCDGLQLLTTRDLDLLFGWIQGSQQHGPNGELFFIFTAESDFSVALQQRWRQWPTAQSAVPPVMLQLPPLSLQESQQFFNHAVGHLIAGSIPLDTPEKILTASAGNPLLLQQFIEQMLGEDSERTPHFDSIGKSTVFDFLIERFTALPTAQSEICYLLAAANQPLPLKWLEEIEQCQRGDVQGLLLKGYCRLSDGGLELRYPPLKGYLLAMPPFVEKESAIRQKLLAYLESGEVTSSASNIQEEALFQRCRLLQLTKASNHTLGLKELMTAVLKHGDVLEKRQASSRAIALYLELAKTIVGAQTSLSGDANLPLLLERLVNSAEFATAARLLDFAKQQATNDNATAEYLALLEQEGRLARFRGDYTQAFAIAENGKKLADKMADKPRKLAFSAIQATVCLLQGRFDECLKVIEANLAEATQSVSPPTPALIQLQLLRGHCLGVMRNFPAAAEQYLQALELAKSIDYAVGIANLEQSFGRVEMYIGQFDEAEERFKSALTVFKRLGQKSGEMSCRLSFAQLQFIKGDFVDAVDNFAAALAYFRALNNQRDLSDALLYFGRLQLFVGHRREGFDNLRFANWLAQNNQLTHLQGLTAWQLGVEELHDGHLVDARVKIEQAMGLFTTAAYQHHHFKCRLLLNLINYLRDPLPAVETQLAKDLEEAIEFLDSMDLREVLTLYLECGFERLGELNIIHLLLSPLNIFAPTERQGILYAYLVGCERRGAMVDQQHLHNYLSHVESAYKRLPESLRTNFLTHCRYAEFQQWRRQRPKRAATLLKEEIKEASPLEAISNLVHQLGQINHQGKLLNFIARKLLSIFAVDKVVLCCSQDQKKLQGLLAQLSANSVVAIPDDFDFVTVSSAKNATENRKSSEWVELFNQYIMQKKSSPQIEEEGRQLVFPLQYQQVPFGFVALIRGTNRKMQVSEMAPLMQILVAQLSMLISQQQNQAIVLGDSRTDDATADTAVTNPDTVGDLGIIAKSSKMREIMEIVQRLQASETTVLIEGESGTGKEVVAKKIHMTSKRRDKPWMKVDCGGVADTLFEAQFFGYVKGAFTGAHNDRLGYFQAANGGTLFLDNISDLSLPNQAKLLRALQDREIHRVGSVVSEKVDVRVIAASQQHLADLCEQGKFRLDLYYRLEVVQIIVPPLRERQEDLAELLQYFAKSFLKRSTSSETRIVITPEAMQALSNYRWPGNVRELANEIERLVLQHGPKSGDTLVMNREQISKKIVSLSQVIPQLVEGRSASAKAEGLGSTLDEIEKNLIQATLAKHRGNISATAKEFKIARVSLRKRMKRLGLMN